MLARLNHPAAKPVQCCDAEPSADPTGTAPIRRKYKSHSNAAWLRLTNAIRKLVIDQDFFGLAAPRGNALMLRVLVSEDQRAQAFSAWLDAMIDAVIKLRLDVMMREARNHATKRAMRLSESNVVPFESAQTVALRDQAVRDLRGITEAVAVNLVRHMAFLQGEKTPPMLYMELAEIIQRIGVVRTNLLIDTYVVAAHASGTLDQFDAAGIESVGIVPEKVGSIRVGDAKRKVAKRYTGPGSRIKKGSTPSKSTLQRIRKAQKKIEKLGRVNVLTAGDDRVCPVCEDISEGGPYTINKARKLIPAHPRCRCAFIPAGDRRFAAEDLN